MKDSFQVASTKTVSATRRAPAFGRPGNAAAQGCGSGQSWGSNNSPTTALDERPQWCDGTRDQARRPLFVDLHHGDVRVGQRTGSPVTLPMARPSADHVDTLNTLRC